MIDQLRLPPLAPPAESALVSVIVPVYQGERIVAGAVRSALEQTHRELEVIVVDDGSTDGTLAALAAIHDPRLVVLHQSNAGTAAARNRALSIARGRYIAFLDSDDRWFPEKIAREIATLQAAPAPVAIAYSSYFAVDDGGRLLNPAPKRTFSGIALDLLLDGEDFLMPSLCLFDRRIFDELGFFQTGCYHEDHEFIVRASRRYPIFPTGERLTVYRQSTSGKCRSILADFERARTEELAVVAASSKVLSPGELDRLRRNALRSLYCRFLMYGFNGNARRLEPEVDLSELRTSKKGRLALIFARFRVNVLVPARSAVQLFHRVARQSAWRRALDRAGLELGYD